MRARYRGPCRPSSSKRRSKERADMMPHVSRGTPPSKVHHREALRSPLSVLCLSLSLSLSLCLSLSLSLCLCLSLSLSLSPSLCVYVCVCVCVCVRARACVSPVVDPGPDRDLNLREQLLHRHGHHVRRGMPDLQQLRRALIGRQLLRHHFRRPGSRRRRRRCRRAHPRAPRAARSGPAPPAPPAAGGKRSPPPSPRSGPAVGGGGRGEGANGRECPISDRWGRVPGRGRAIVGGCAMREESMFL